MSRCVPSWDLEEVNTNHDCFGLEYEVAELKWENGQLAMHELSSRRVPSNYRWEKPRTAETLEAIVNQATLQPYCKTDQVAVNVDNELVPCLNHHLPTAGGVDASATMTSDALVPSSNNRTEVDLRSDQARQSTTSARDAGCSTRVGSCSGDPSAFVDWRVGRGGGTTVEAHDWSSCRDQSVSESGTLATIDTYGGDLGGRRWTSTSTGSPENTSSGKDFSKSTSLDDSDSHPRTQEVSVIKEKKRVKEKFSISNKRRRTPAMHNQSERKRRDKINERMKTLQKLVPNSSKTDKVSMLEEIIEYVKQLQVYADMMSRMNMSSMMMPMPLAMQQQQQQQHILQMSMMNSMGMGGIGLMGMGFNPSPFMHMPSWNAHTANTFLACQPPQPMNMDNAYTRMSTLYQHMQNQQGAQNSKK